MIDQTSLRGVTWSCANSAINCDAVLPCFDADGRVHHVLLVTREWGWLVMLEGGVSKRPDVKSGSRSGAPAVVREGTDYRFAGPLESLYKLGPRLIGRLGGLFHYDPWWLARGPGGQLPAEVVDALVATNLATRGQGGGRDDVSQVRFDDGLTRVESIELGSALWRRQLTGSAIGAWLAGRRPGPPTGSPGDTSPGEQAPLYEPTDGPLRRISSQRRASGGRVTIGQVEPGGEGGPIQFRFSGIGCPGPLGRPASATPPASAPAAPPPSIEAAPAEPPPLPPQDRPPPAERRPGPPRIGQQAVPATPKVRTPPQPPDRERPARLDETPQSPIPPTARPVQPAQQPPRPPAQQPPPDEVQQAIENVRRRIQRGRGR